MKNIVKFAVYGLAIGSLVELSFSILFSLIEGSSVFFRGTPTFLAQFGDNTLAAAALTKLVYALLGVAFGFGGKVLQSDRLSLLAATVVHFGMTLAAIIFAGFGLKWIPLSLAGFALFIVFFLLVYAATWTIIRFFISRQVREINTRLQKSAS